MANLDFYIEDNGRIKYSKNLSLTQYSTSYTVRLLTKKTFYVVNMNVTTGNGLNTYKKNLILQTSKTTDGYYSYNYTLGLDATGYEFQDEKSTLKLAFYIYPETGNLDKVFSSTICYLPLLKSVEDMPSDGSVSKSELSNIQSEINNINKILADLDVGNIETAKNYDPTEGTIKDKFNELELKIIKNTTDLTELNIEQVRQSISTNTANITKLQSQVNTNTDNISDLQTIVKQLQEAGVKYTIVSSLPTTGKEGMIYLVPASESETHNYYNEYMWINNIWEIIGSTQTKVDLSEYYTKTQTDTKFATKEELPTKTSQLTNDSGFLTEHQSLDDYATKVEVSTVESKIPTKVSQLTNDSGFLSDADVGNIQSQVNTNTDNISDLQESVSEANEAANQALMLAKEKHTLVYQDVPTMMEALKTLVPNAVVGTNILIVDQGVPDFWIGAVLSSNTGSYTYNGTTYTGLYYTLYELEGKVDLSDYYSISDTDRLFAKKADVNAELDNREKVSNKVTSILSSATDVEYPSARAVRTYVINRINDLESDIDGTYATKALLTSTSDTLTAAIEKVDADYKAADKTISASIENVESGLATEVSDRKALDTRVSALESQGLGAVIDDDNISTSKTYSSKKIDDTYLKAPDGYLVLDKGILELRETEEASSAFKIRGRDEKLDLTNNELHFMDSSKAVAYQDVSIKPFFGSEQETPTIAVNGYKLASVLEVIKKLDLTGGTLTGNLQIDTGTIFSKLQIGPVNGNLPELRIFNQELNFFATDHTKIFQLTPEWDESGNGYHKLKNQTHYFAYEDWVESKGYLTQTDLSTVESKIPTKVSQLENDSNYLTEHQSLTDYATKTWVEDKDYLTKDRSTLVSLIGNASQTLEGLLSADDKKHLDALYAVLGESADEDSFVNTINEILAVFSKYPEGTDIMEYLNSKVNISDITDSLISDDKGKVLSAYGAHTLKQIIDSETSARESADTALSTRITTLEKASVINDNLISDGTTFSSQKISDTYLPLSGGTLTGRLTTPELVIPIDTTSDSKQIQFNIKDNDGVESQAFLYADSWGQLRFNSLVSASDSGIVATQSYVYKQKFFKYGYEVENRTELADLGSTFSKSNTGTVVHVKDPNMIAVWVEDQFFDFSSDYKLSSYALKTELPTKTSELTNDSGFLTEHQSLDDYATKEYVDSKEVVLPENTIVDLTTEDSTDGKKYLKTVTTKGGNTYNVSEKLVAGEGITIEGNTISASKGSAVVFRTWED